MSQQEQLSIERSNIDAEDRITRIDFPRPIGEAEADELIRYFVAQLDEIGTNKRNLEISVDFSQNRHYGSRLLNEIKEYERLSDVSVRRGETRISGAVTSGLPSLEAASFEFRKAYDKFSRPVFIGIDFCVTPGCRLGELRGDSPEIMKNIGTYVLGYFESDRLGNFAANILD